jgi:hypothetical protein
LSVFIMFIVITGSIQYSLKTAFTNKKPRFLSVAGFC